MGDLKELGTIYAIESWCSFITEFLNIRAIRARQVTSIGNAPRPDDGEFATVYVTGTQRTGYPDVDYRNADALLSESLRNLFSYTASINFYRRSTEAPVDLANRFEMTLHSGEGITKLLNFKMGVLQVSPVRDLTGIVNNQWESRAQLDVDFCMPMEYISQLPYIESVGVIGEVEVDGNTIEVLVDL